MIIVEKFEPVTGLPVPGRELVLSGDGPFALAISCFVDKPDPAGFRPCDACKSETINSYEKFFIRIDPNFWRGTQGRILIEIRDAVGATHQLDIVVLNDIDGSPTGMLQA